MGKIAARILAGGDGWTVEDVTCTAGPADRSFEEQHSWTRIAIVVAGTFQYRSSFGTWLMTPGSLLLGNPGQSFECAHDHGVGDRCISFGYAPGRSLPAFRQSRVPPLRALARFVARACHGVSGSSSISWEELSVGLAGAAAEVAEDAIGPGKASSRDVARVVDVARFIERSPESPLTLNDLARMAGLSAHHFLRTFETVIGVTPHQYVLRSRLRIAAQRLRNEPAKVIDVALDSGFGDVSNFNHAFRSEFGMSPRRYRFAGSEDA